MAEIKTKETTWRAGVDIGGTKVRIGLVDNNGELFPQQLTLRVADYSSGKDFARDIAKVIRSLATQAQGILLGVGLGCPGPLDARREVVLETPHLPFLHGFPLVAEVQRYFQVPVRMNNDANLFVLGEALYGAGKGLDPVYGMTLGTGFGHGFVWGGRILDGAHGAATEYGHAPYLEGTYEDFVSAAGVSRLYQQLTGEYCAPVEISTRAAAGDEAARATWARFGEAVGTAIVHVMKMLDPAIVVIGGAMRGAFEWFAPRMEEVVRPTLWSSQRDLTIVPASLGDGAPLIGAAALIQV